MGYAIHLYFDAQTEARIVALWQTLAAQGISSEMPDINARPHISLAVFEAPPPNTLRAALSTFAQQTPPLNTLLSAVGTFPTAEGVVFLAPVVTRQLLAAHSAFHQGLDKLGIITMDYYRPGQWVPHCTVAIRLPSNKVSTAVAIARRAAVFGAVDLLSVGLVEFRPVIELYEFPLSAIGSSK